MIKNRNFENKFSQNPIKQKNTTKINMMASGGVNELGGINKKIFEKFFGVALPKIKIHKTTESIGKASRYHAHSYAQGNNIYLGKDVKPIDTVEGQTVIAHEITHVLQQKYLDMSSQKEMVDPSIELERKAKVVEDRVRVTKGIDKSSGDYFRKWDVLPQRSYLARGANIGHSNKDNIIQRLDFSLNIDWGEVGSSLVDATVNQAKNIGGALSEAGSTALDGVSSVGKLAVSGYTGMVAEGADLLGYEDTANSLRKTTNTLQQSAIYDFNEASSHLSKSGKYGTNVLGSVIGNQKVFSDKEIESTTGIVEELSPTWKKDDKYNKTLTEFGNKAIGAGLKGVQNLTGDFFTMKYGSWQYKSAEKYTNFIESVGSGLQKFDKTYLQQNIVTETLSNSVKGAVNSTIIKPGKNIAKSLEEGKFIESGTDLVSNANIATIAMNSTSGSLDGNITTLESHNIISEKQAEKFKVAKDTTLAMTKLAFDIKNAKTKKDIANKRTNTLNTNIEAGKYTKNRVKGLFTVSDNAVKSANYEMLKSSVGLFTEGAKGFDKYQGAKKDSQMSKNFQFLDTLVDNKISYKNLESIDKIGLMGEESKVIPRSSQKTTLESTKNIHNSLNSIDNIMKKKDKTSSFKTPLTLDEITKKYGYGKFREEASDVYSPENFFKKDKNGKYTNQKIDIDPKTSSTLAPLGLMDFMSQSTDYKLVLSEMTNDGLETYMKRIGYPTDSELTNFNVDYKLVFRGTWPSQFNEKTLKHDDKFDYRDIWEDAWERGQRQAKSAKKIYRKYFLKEKAFFDLAPAPYKIKFNEMNFIGHSLGGYLANSTMVDFTTNRSLYGGMKVNNIYAETYPITSTAVTLGVGAVGAGAYYASKGYEWASNKVVDGTKWLGNKAIGLKDSIVSGTKKAYNFGVEKLSQAGNFIVNTAQNIGNSISTGAEKAYNFAEKKSKQFGSMLNHGVKEVSNKVNEVGHTISTGVENAYDFTEEKIEEFGDTVSKGWNSVTDFFKFAEVNRHQQKPIQQNGITSQSSSTTNNFNTMENQLDELSIKIFRKLKNEIALEYVRSGRN